VEFQLMVKLREPVFAIAIGGKLQLVVEGNFLVAHRTKKVHVEEEHFERERDNENQQRSVRSVNHCAILRVQKRAYARAYVPPPRFHERNYSNESAPSNMQRVSALGKT
jgi:hypothetical protein